MTNEVLPPMYDGNSELNKWFQLFDECAMLNGWDYERQGQLMPALLEGDAWLVFLHLPKDKRALNEVKEALIEAFSLPEGWKDVNAAVLTSCHDFSVQATSTRAMPETNASKVRSSATVDSLNGVASTMTSNDAALASRIDELERELARLRVAVESSTPAIQTAAAAPAAPRAHVAARAQAAAKAKAAARTEAAAEAEPEIRSAKTETRASIETAAQGEESAAEAETTVSEATTVIEDMTGSEDMISEATTASEATTVGERRSEASTTTKASETCSAEKAATNAGEPSTTAGETVATTTPVIATATTTAAAPTRQATADAAEKAPSQAPLEELSPDASFMHVRLLVCLPADGLLPEELDRRISEQPVSVSGARAENGELWLSSTLRNQRELPAQTKEEQLRVHLESEANVVLEEPAVTAVRRKSSVLWHCMKLAAELSHVRKYRALGRLRMPAVT